MQPCPKKYTASPTASLPATVPVLGISNDSSCATEETIKPQNPQMLQLQPQNAII